MSQPEGHIRWLRILVNGDRCDQRTINKERISLRGLGRTVEKTQSGQATVEFEPLVLSKANTVLYRLYVNAQLHILIKLMVGMIKTDLCQNPETGFKINPESDLSV